MKPQEEIATETMYMIIGLPEKNTLKDKNILRQQPQSIGEQIEMFFHLSHHTKALPRLPDENNFLSQTEIVLGLKKNQISLGDKTKTTTETNIELGGCARTRLLDENNFASQI